MKEWWLNLALREQQMVSLGAAAILLALIYGLIWSPLHNGISSLREQIQHNQQLLSWMQAADLQLQASEKMAQKPAVVSTNTSRLSIVQNSLKESPIASNVTQLVSADNDSVKLNFQQVDFDLLITWLTELWQQQGLITTQTTITAGTTPGMVTAELILK